MNVIIIQKNGTIENKIMKDFNKIYSLCKYRSNNSFVKLHTWLCEDYVLELYGKEKDKEININHFEFPSPIEYENYYGNLCVVKLNLKEEVIHLDIEEWNTWYKNMFEDFESIESVDNLSEKSDEICFILDQNNELDFEDYIDESQ
jgi:alpha-L-arabinofuranosidase